MMTPELVKEFNKHFEDEVAVWVDPDGTTKFRTVRGEMHIKEGQITKQATLRASYVSTEYWLRHQIEPRDAYPFTKEEVDVVVQSLRTLRLSRDSLSQEPVRE